MAHYTVLFIGDSITDGGWGNSGGTDKPSEERALWDKNHIFGHGFMYIQDIYDNGYEYYNYDWNTASLCEAVLKGVFGEPGYGK